MLAEWKKKNKNHEEGGTALGKFSFSHLLFCYNNAYKCIRHDQLKCCYASTKNVLLQKIQEIVGLMGTRPLHELTAVN